MAYSIFTLLLSNMTAVALVMSALFLFIFWLERITSALVVSVLWCCYMLYELSTSLGFIGKHLVDGRVDLLVIVPILFALTFASTVSGAVRHSYSLRLAR